jgi:hypothetical protein
LPRGHESHSSLPRREGRVHYEAFTKLRKYEKIAKEGFPSPSLSSLEDVILDLPLAIMHLCDDRKEHDEEWWL